MRRFLRSFLRNDSGSVAPTVGLSLIALIAAGGLAFDYSRVAAMDTELQNAADQAALAAATQLDGLANADIRIISGDATSAEAHQVAVGPDRTVELRVLVTVRGRPVAPSEPIAFVLTDIFTGVAERVDDHFRSPSP